MYSSSHILLMPHTCTVDTTHVASCVMYILPVHVLCVGLEQRDERPPTPAVVQW